MPHNAKTVRIAVLSRDKEEEKAIKEAFRASDADLVLMPTIHRLRDLLFTQPCSGLLLCLKSLVVGLDYNSKSFIQTLEQVYPVARIRWNKSKGSFALISSRSRHVETLSDFIAICSNFAPRCLRRSERLFKTLNVLLSAAPDLANSTRAFTMNISMRGCFLHTPIEWKVGDSVYMQIQELPGKNVMEGKVMRSVQWEFRFPFRELAFSFPT